MNPYEPICKALDEWMDSKGWLRCKICGKELVQDWNNTNELPHCPDDCEPRRYKNEMS